MCANVTFSIMDRKQSTYIGFLNFCRTIILFIQIFVKSKTGCPNYDKNTVFFFWGGGGVAG